jgi:hypothetical protein
MTDLSKHAEAIFKPFGMSIYDMDDPFIVREVHAALTNIIHEAFDAGAKAGLEKAEDKAQVMRKTWSSRFGTDEEQGIWDQSLRIEGQIRAIDPASLRSDV